MESFTPLNPTSVAEAMEKLRKADPDHTTVEEYESLLVPLFKGLQVYGSSLDIDSIVYRCRKMSTRPSKIAQITYPLPQFVTRQGRANKIGQSMFYGSIGSKVPLFEIDAQPGDYIVISRWKVLETVILNHVGYSQSAIKDEKNLRNLILPMILLPKQ